MNNITAMTPRVMRGDLLVPVLPTSKLVGESAARRR